MTNKGKNRGAGHSNQTEDGARKLKRDEQVHRDPDIAGAGRRTSRDVHQRDRTDPNRRD